MQEGMVLGCSPIAAVDRVLAKKIKGTCNIASVELGHDQKNILVHRGAHRGEKLASEVSRSPFARASVHVKAKKRVPMAFQYAGARQKLDLNAIGKSLLSFAPDHLSFARGKIGQEGIEIGIALVEKMKLLSASLQKAGT
jgi:hypothetical protein